MIYERAYPVLLVKRTISAPWRAEWVGSFVPTIDAGTGWSAAWQTALMDIESVYAFRLVAKDITTVRDPDKIITNDRMVYFDDVYAGEESLDDAIQFYDVPKEKRQMFERIIMQSKPLATWAGLVVRYV